MERVDALPNLSPVDRSRYKSFIRKLAQLKETLPGHTHPISNIVQFQELPLHDQKILLHHLDYNRLMSSVMCTSVERLQDQLEAQNPRQSEPASR